MHSSFLRLGGTEIVPGPDAETDDGNWQTDHGRQYCKSAKVFGRHFMKPNAKGFLGHEENGNKEEHGRDEPDAARICDGGQKRRKKPSHAIDQNQADSEGT